MKWMNLVLLPWLLLWNMLWLKWLSIHKTVIRILCFFKVTALIPQTYPSLCLELSIVVCSSWCLLNQCRKEFIYSRQSQWCIRVHFWTFRTLAIVLSTYERMFAYRKSYACRTIVSFDYLIIKLEWIFVVVFSWHKTPLGYLRFVVVVVLNEYL